MFFVESGIEAIDQSMYVSGFKCTLVFSISVISVVLSGYRCVPLFVHSGLPNTFNPLSPHDALKHYFTSMKTYLTFLKQRILERKFP